MGHPVEFQGIRQSWAEIALFPIQEGLPARPKKFILANLIHQESPNLVAGYSEQL